ncbi:V-type proton ATPase subunit S1-like, partial [Leucoraja erinacea]|uniref:V-type proton ATPase subunit S1-like n=1 Tax=Leucoraja erinaceus TaxID=7782 RepID=UPI0024548DF2
MAAAVGPAVWLLVLALGSTPRGGSGAARVPLLAWSTEASLFGSQAAPSEGHVLSGLQMAAYLNPALAKGPKTIVLFLQDKLSVDDFTAYGGVYGNRQDSAFPSLQAALDSSASSLVLPAVDWRAATTLLPTLQVAVGAGPLYVDQLTIRELRLNASVPSLLVVNLPYTSSSILIRPKEALTANDNIVGKVLEVLKREGVPFTAVLTGSRPSRVSVGDVDHWGCPRGGCWRWGRRLGAAGTPHPPLGLQLERS